MGDHKPERPSVLLINPGHEPHERAAVRYKEVPRDAPPYFALRLSGKLKQEGIDVMLLDTHVHDDWESQLCALLRERRFTAVGMTVYLGLFLSNAREISAIVREVSPGSAIVWGGPVPSSTPEEALTCYDIDYAVRFEGEVTMAELTWCLHKGEDVAGVRGLSYREGEAITSTSPRPLDREGLDKFPIPDWGLVKDFICKDQTPYFANIMSSHGCPFRCSFCYHISSDDPKSVRWRNRSVDHVMSEVDYLHGEHGITVFSFGDDNFLTNRKRAMALFQEFRKRGFIIEELVSHFNNFNDEVIEAMEGLVASASFAIEAATPELMDTLNKRLDLDKLPGVVAKLWEHGVIIDSSLIVGVPGETNADLRATFELMRDLRWIHPQFRASSCMLNPIPHTDIVPIIERCYGVTLPKDLPTYEAFNEHPLDEATFEKLRVFHPYMDEERLKVLTGFQVVFRDLFRYNKMSDASLEYLEGNKTVAEIFDGWQSLPRPRDGYSHYMLNRVLNGEAVDIKRLLHDNVIWPDKPGYTPVPISHQKTTTVCRTYVA